MYLRKSEIVNDVFSHTLGGLRQPISNGFMVQGTAIQSKRNMQELSHSKGSDRVVKGKEISIRPAQEKSSQENFVCNKPFSPRLRVKINNKTERRQEGNNTQINEMSEMSIKSSTEIFSTELQRTQFGLRLLRNQKESALHNLATKYKSETDSRTETPGVCRSRVDSPSQRKSIARTRSQSTNDISTLSLNNERIKTDGCQQTEDKLYWSGGTCEQNVNLERSCSANREEKRIEIKGKRYGAGSAGRIKALHCALSRKRDSVDQKIPDEDYQRIDYEYFLKLKAVSRLSRLCDDSVIDAVAKENSAHSIEKISLPPVIGSKWKLKDRFVSGLTFNPPTAVLREYTRISQARVVDFSDSSLGGQVL